MATRYLAGLISTGRRSTAAGPFFSTLAASTSDPKSEEKKLRNLRNRERSRTCKHWSVTILPSSTQLTKDQLIHIYVKTLAKVVGSEDEAKKRIYQAYTGANMFLARISWEQAQTLEELPWVRRVGRDESPNSNYNVNEGELVIDKQVVSYDEAFRKSESINEWNDGTMGINNDPEKTPTEWDLFMDNVHRFKKKYKSFEHMMRGFEIFKCRLKRIEEFYSSSTKEPSYFRTYTFVKSREEIN